MAQVIMDDKEYWAMMKKCEEFDNLQAAMVKACSVEIDTDTEGNVTGCYINIDHVYTPTIKENVINKIVASLTPYDRVMDKLVELEYHCLNVTKGRLSYSWYPGKEIDLYDLCDNSQFKKAWDKAITREKTKEELFIPGYASTEGQNGK